MTEADKIKKIKKHLSEATSLYASIEGKDFKLYLKLLSLNQEFGRIRLKILKERKNNG